MLAGAGYLKLEDLRKIVHNLGQGLSLKTVKDLTVNVTDASSRYCVCCPAMACPNIPIILCLLETALAASSRLGCTQAFTMQPQQIL